MARTAFIVSISSDIGAALATRWLGRGWKVAGTFRTETPAVARLRELGAELLACDLSCDRATAAAAAVLAALGPWDALVLCPGSTEPIGPFASTDFDAWATSLTVNFTNQLRLVHGLLPSRRLEGAQPLVLFFAGGGTNGATVNYSAYTLSKIALIKACELLDAEMPSVRFSIVGPGWVDTKIHRETLQAGALAGDNLRRTEEKIASGDFTAMDDVLDCCDWLADAPRAAVGGRNFSVAFDPWRQASLEGELRADPDLYKLRRRGNDRFAPLQPSET